MNIDVFLKKITDHTKSIYQNEIDQVVESGKINNWLLGLAGGALIFSFNRHDTIEHDTTNIVIFQLVVFLIIICIGLLHRVKTKSFRDHTISMIRMFDFLRIEFELIPNTIEEEIENKDLMAIFNNYINGEYFIDSDKEIFMEISSSQKKVYNTTKILTVVSIVLMLLQYSAFFILIAIN